MLTESFVDNAILIIQLDMRNWNLLRSYLQENLHKVIENY